MSPIAVINDPNFDNFIYHENQEKLSKCCSKFCLPKKTKKQNTRIHHATSEFFISRDVKPK